MSKPKETKNKSEYIYNTNIKKEKPKKDQESVWDYPRPPRIEDEKKELKLFAYGTLIAKTKDAKRVLETSHPPVYYFPRSAVSMKYLEPLDKNSSYCEFKGVASYFDIKVSDGKVIKKCCWSYLNPTQHFSCIKNYIAFYISDKNVEAYWGGEKCKPQGSSFYGGWIHSGVCGPFKGCTPDSMWW